MRRITGPILLVACVCAVVAYASGLPIRGAAARWQATALILSAGWMLLVPGAVFAWLCVRHGVSRAARAAAIALRSPWGAALLTASGVAAMVAFRISAAPGSGFLTFFDALSHTSIFIGIAIAGAGRAAVRGPPRCRDCGYEQGAANVDFTLCPECGLDWTKRGAILRRRVTLRPRIIVLGVLIAFTPLALDLIGLRRGFGRQALAVRIAPTASLIAEVTAPPRGFRYDHWNELSTRTLTHNQRESLAQGLLTLRLRTGRLDTEAENWLDAQVAASAISPGLAQRFVAESLDVEVRSLAPAVVGRPAQLALFAVDRGGWRFTAAGTPLMVLVADPSDRPDAVPGERIVAIHPIRMGDPTRAPSPEAILSFTPDVPGTQRVYVRVWIVRAPLNTGWPATADSAGQPPRPAWRDALGTAHTHARA